MQSSLEHIFGSRTRVKLLRLFTSDADSTYFVRELSRKVGEHMNSVRRELGLLEKIGFVQSETKEQKKYYRANPDNVLFPEMKGLFVKADLLLEQDFAEKIQETGRIKLILLSGFFVGLNDSLIDLLVVGQVNKRKFVRLVNGFSKLFDREIRYTTMTRKDFDYRRQVTDRFLYRILGDEHIILYNQLHASAEERDASLAL
jgi:hypothetical protein